MTLWEGNTISIYIILNGGIYPAKKMKGYYIVYRRPYIDDVKKTISKGRLFVDTTYKNDIMNFDLVYREYAHLVRWLKNI